MGSHLVQRSLAGGEISEAMASRADLELYTRALRTCLNFIPQREGGVENRPGTRFRGSVKTPADRTWAYPYESEFDNRSTLIEVGDLYFRFWRFGELLMSGMTPVEVVTPYTLASLDTPLRFSQDSSTNTITITHPNYPTAELKYVSDTVWTYSVVTFGPTIAAPTGFAVTANGLGAGALNPKYVVTAAKAETLEESLPCAAVGLTNVQEPTADDPNLLSWTAVTGAAEYRIYKDPFANGTFGYIGTATGQVTFQDVGGDDMQPDFLNTPPQDRTIFAAPLDYPDACATFQQRRIFGYSGNKVQGIWGSRVGFPYNFSIRSPLQDDDAITAALVARHLHAVRHLIPLKKLLVGTHRGAWLMRGDGDGVLKPSALNADQVDYTGMSRVEPQIIGTTVVFLEARGSRFFDLQFDGNVDQAVKTRDLTVFANHLFAGYSFSKVLYQRNPDSVLWCLRSDGVLLSCTYSTDEDTWAWARHDVSGVVEDICLLPEGPYDRLYLIVRRTIDGDTVRYVEQLEERWLPKDNVSAAFFVDCGITQTASATTSVTGLDHLEGESVMALADGIVQGPFTVTAGAITLTTAAAVVHVGLPITADLETLDIDVNGTDVRAKRKRLAALKALVQASVGYFYAGPDASHLFLQRRESWLPASSKVSGQFEVTLASTFNQEGRVLLRHTQPTPLAIVGLIPEVEIGG